ncbi:UNVERIFIED_CONTAM: hypothetical protein FKN15_044972 [Acipenser sinensis]
MRTGPGVTRGVRERCRPQTPSLDQDSNSLAIRFEINLIDTKKHCCLYKCLLKNSNPFRRGLEV